MPSSHRYSIVEPHPSAQSQTFISTGRGGAGNVTKIPSSITRGSDASGPAARIPLSQPHKPFASGRGGAGNIHPPSERAIFSFDEELERQLSQEKKAAPVFHVGRGGAGNINGTIAPDRLYSYLEASARRASDESSRNSTKSTSSADSGAEYATRHFKKGWKKITGVGSYMSG